MLPRWYCFMCGEGVEQVKDYTEAFREGISTHRKACLTNWFDNAPQGSVLRLPTIVNKRFD